MNQIERRQDMWQDAMRKRAQSDTECLVWAYERIRGQQKQIRNAGMVTAYINHGRWVADCNCNSGMAVDPDSTSAICLECGAVWHVTFPQTRERERIERALLLRPNVANRNWLPNETVSDLEAETRERMTAELADLQRRLSELGGE